jgi:hypothetical protein
MYINVMQSIIYDIYNAFTFLFTNDERCLSLLEHIIAIWFKISRL